jgi:hypothetical protein
MEDVGIFYGHLVYFMAIGYMWWQIVIFYLCLFGAFFTVLVCCTKKNLATLLHLSPELPVWANFCLLGEC